MLTTRIFGSPIVWLTAVLLTAVLVTGAWVVLPGAPANAGAARTETATSAAEMVLNMGVSSFRGSRGSPVGRPGSLIMETTLVIAR